MYLCPLVVRAGRRVIAGPLESWTILRPFLVCSVVMEPYMMLLERTFGIFLLSVSADMAGL